MLVSKSVSLHKSFTVISGITLSTKIEVLYFNLIPKVCITDKGNYSNPSSLAICYFVSVIKCTSVLVPNFSESAIFNIQITIILYLKQEVP